MPFAHLTASKSKSQVFDDVCSELAMAILQFFQVSNIASLYRSFILQKSKILNQSKLISMLSRGSLQRSTFSGVWEHFPHSARSTGRSVFNIIIASSSSSSSILSSSSRTSTTTQPHMHHGDHQVPQLVKMIGPDPSKFSGLSTRVDEQLG